MENFNEENSVDAFKGELHRLILEYLSSDEEEQIKALEQRIRIFYEIAQSRHLEDNLATEFTSEELEHILSCLEKYLFRFKLAKTEAAKLHAVEMIQILYNSVYNGVHKEVVDMFIQKLPNQLQEILDDVFVYCKKVEFEIDEAEMTLGYATGVQRMTLNKALKKFEQDHS